MARNIDKIQVVAQALGEIKEQVVFVGGSVAELYADNPELSDIRPTIDVDCVVDLTINTYLEYSKLEEQLRKLDFQNDTSKNAPVCRKLYNGIKVDFMPENPDILGFSIIWGGSDIRGSHDWEDIVYILNYCGIFLQNFRQYNNPKLISYLKENFRNLMNNNNIREIIYSALPYHSEEESIDALLDLMNKIQTI